MYIHIHVKHPSDLHYCYETPFYTLWENAIPEVIIGFYKSFSSPLDHLSLSDLGV